MRPLATERLGEPCPGTIHKGAIEGVDTREIAETGEREPSARAVLFQSLGLGKAALHIVRNIEHGVVRTL